ncbi:hypothetical protein Airi02_105700 [Actinoallomurus iriomotensis]|uniref:Uncharacterized protein n=1 Tax=Actinoallomurus iriomotensis TaxID=478107 RepID=A0A9W6SGQ8_9ACTN|nr:hypothetical protein Airi02_105700 [Actinoallomurus iriomotensis]
MIVVINPSTRGFSTFKAERPTRDHAVINEPYSRMKKVQCFEAAYDRGGQLCEVGLVDLVRGCEQACEYG